MRDRLVAEILPLINLANVGQCRGGPDEIEKLPATLRDKISATFTLADAIGVWLVGDKAEGRVER